MGQVRTAILIVVLGGALQVFAGHQRFFPDDPIQAMPPPLPVEAPLRREVNFFYDFFYQSAKRDPRRPVIPAGAINTLGDVPDSEWFTNRHGRRRMTRAELQRGPGPDDRPEPPFTVIDGKSEGITPGFLLEDSKGRKYFAKVDPLHYPELGTAAEVIASKFFYAIGYNTPNNQLVHLKLSDLRVSDTAKITLADRRTRKMTWNDVVEIVENIPHYPDGSFRIVASLSIDGDYVGPFRYEGTRKDDPNDIVPHENRRDLRGLFVFCAWLNHTDTKANNSLDTVVESNGIPFIRHYLVDFGSALGSDGDHPKDVRAGHEFAMPTPTKAVTRIVNLGIVPSPWERQSFPDLPAVGNFSSKLFNPDSWTPITPNPAFRSRLPDDDFWAAKQVMAFTDDDIRAIVETGEFSDKRSAEYISTTLAVRRDKIGQTFFSKVLPLDHFRIENEELGFDDLAVNYGFLAPRSYVIQWSRFDNFAQTHDPIAADGSARLPAEVKQAVPNSYFSAFITSPGNLHTVSVYIRKEGTGFKVVGIERRW